jgi:hypothetical protein
MTMWLQRANNPERVEHIFSVDHDDETAATLNRFGGVVQTEDGYSVGAWNLAAENSTGEIMIQLSDDIELFGLVNISLNKRMMHIIFRDLKTIHRMAEKN